MRQLKFSRFFCTHVYIINSSYVLHSNNGDDDKDSESSVSEVQQLAQKLENVSIHLIEILSFKKLSKKKGRSMQIPRTIGFL